MKLTEKQILSMFPKSTSMVSEFVPALNAAMDHYQIVGRRQVAAFLAQVGHESDQLTRMVENLNYGASALMSTWPKRFPPALASACARQPELIANIAYGGRMGNTEPGDGWRYRGRGLIQITGKNNYLAAGSALKLELLETPQLLEVPAHAAMSAAWYWAESGLNELAETDQFIKITQAINGGLNGLEERLALRDRIVKMLT